MGGINKKMLRCSDGHFTWYMTGDSGVIGFSINTYKYTISVWMNKTIIQTNPPDFSPRKDIAVFNYPLFFDLEDDRETISISRLLNRVDNLIPFS